MRSSVRTAQERRRSCERSSASSRPNVLVMDEPTNHMDMESIESLNLALELYQGTLVVVSHDRQFVSSLATQVIELGGPTPVHYTGSYEDYLGSRAPR